VVTGSATRVGPVGVAIVGPASSSTLIAWPQTLQNLYPASFTSPQLVHFMALDPAVARCALSGLIVLLIAFLVMDDCVPAISGCGLPQVESAI
jgi:hypothetical protein